MMPHAVLLAMSLTQSGLSFTGIMMSSACEFTHPLLIHSLLEKLFNRQAREEVSLTVIFFEVSL